MDVVQPGSARTKPIRPKAIRRARMAVAGSARRLPLVRRYPLTWARASMDARARHADFEGVQAYVMFVGYPRSGHSLVGALLDAHPDAIVAHELDALKYLPGRLRSRPALRPAAPPPARPRRRRAGVGLGLRLCRPHRMAGPVPAAARHRRQEGRAVDPTAPDEPALLDELARTVGVPVKVIHVVRDPYDNIATMCRWAARPLEDQVDAYFELAGVAASVQARVDPDDFHELHTEDLVADPRATLTALAAFLGLPDWGPDLEAATSVVFPNPRRTRRPAPWTPELRRRVADLAAAHAALARYDGAG